MPTIVYQTNQKTGVKYAYLSTSYWDKDKKAPRSTRKYLGRVDPETGDIIKGSGKNREVVRVSGDDAAIDGQACDNRDAEIASLEARLAEMTARYEKAAQLLREIGALAGMID